MAVARVRTDGIDSNRKIIKVFSSPQVWPGGGEQDIPPKAGRESVGRTGGRRGGEP